MKNKIIILSTLVISLISCQGGTESIPNIGKTETIQWNEETLNKKAQQDLDSSNWDQELFAQDKETYSNYFEMFKEYPLNKSPFPVAEYEYAVSSYSFDLVKNKSTYKGVSIGEYENYDSDKVIQKLTLFILTDDQEAEEVTMVESRNSPYLTAQGYFNFSNQKYDWVFSASPDGYSTLLINMKLFDLRFGETIIIYPQTDQSFHYDQINDSPNNYVDFEDYKTAIIEKLRR